MFAGVAAPHKPKKKKKFVHSAKSPFEKLYWDTKVSLTAVLSSNLLHETIVKWPFVLDEKEKKCQFSLCPKGARYIFVSISMNLLARFHKCFETIPTHSHHNFNQCIFNNTKVSIERQHLMMKVNMKSDLLFVVVIVTKKFVGNFLFWSIILKFLAILFSILSERTIVLTKWDHIEAFDNVNK